MNKEELDNKILYLNAHIKILKQELEWQDILDIYSYRYGPNPKIYEKGKELKEKLKEHQNELEKFKLEYKTRFIDPFLEEMRLKYKY